MLRLLTTLALATLSLTVFGQKIKLKKEVVLVDKQPVLSITKVSGKGLDDKKTFALVATNGDTLIVFSGDVATYVQLPHEKEPRKSHYFMEADVRSQNRKIVLDYAAVFFRRWMYKALLEAEAIDANGLVLENLNALFEVLGKETVATNYATMEEVNVRRQINYNLSKEAFGELTKRSPSSVGFASNFLTDGTKKVAHFLVKSTSSYGQLYSVKRMNGATPGKEIGTLFHTPEDGRFFFRLIRGNEENKYEFFLEPGPRSDELLAKAGERLIIEGYL